MRSQPLDDVGAKPRPDVVVLGRAGSGKSGAMLVALEELHLLRPTVAIATVSSPRARPREPRARRRTATASRRRSSRSDPDEPDDEPDRVTLAAEGAR